MIELIQELKQKCRFDTEIGASLDLTEKEIVFLSAIADKKDITSKKLSLTAGLSPSRSSRVISALYEKGYITMIHDNSDRRMIKLNLTSKGRNCVSIIEKEKRRCESELLEGLSEEQKETVRIGLNILLKNL